MQKQAKIYVAGHRGLVGSAIVRALRARGFTNLILRTHVELDLTDQRATEAFFVTEKPEVVFLAAAKVGGIYANNTYPAEFIYQNLAIQANVIHSAYLHNVNRLLFLGSSCIYPRDCPQPIREEYLLTGPLELTNRAYALAKIAGIEMCWSYNRQYGTNYLSVMPANLYGPGDNYDLNTSHVVPALIRKFHEAKLKQSDEVIVWGTGLPRREFMHCDDMADACVELLSLDEGAYAKLINPAQDTPPLINIGTGIDVTIQELANLIRNVTGYSGQIVFDPEKPDGTPRKLLDVSRINSVGWRHKIELKVGLASAYLNFIEQLSG